MNAFRLASRAILRRPRRTLQETRWFRRFGRLETHQDQSCSSTTRQSSKHLQTWRASQWSRTHFSESRTTPSSQFFRNLRALIKRRLQTGSVRCNGSALQPPTLCRRLLNPRIRIRLRSSKKVRWRTTTNEIMEEKRQEWTPEPAKTGLRQRACLYLPQEAR